MPKRISTAIAEKHSVGCWRFCRTCGSLAHMTKTKKSESATQTSFKAVANARAKNGAGKRPSTRGGTPDPTNPRRVAAILAKLDGAYPNGSCELKRENPWQLRGW